MIFINVQKEIEMMIKGIFQIIKMIGIRSIFWMKSKQRKHQSFMKQLFFLEIYHVFNRSLYSIFIFKVTFSSWKQFYLKNSLLKNSLLKNGYIFFNNY